MSDTVIAFGSAATEAADLDDCQFLTSVAWRKSADRSLVAAASAGDTAAFCKVLRQVLSRRRTRRPKQKPQVLPQLLQPLWSQHAWDDAATSASLSAVLIALQKQLEKQAGAVSRKASRQVRDTLQEAPIRTSPWTQLAWLTVLVTAADLLDDETLLQLWRQSLVSVASQLRGPQATDWDSEDVADDRQLLVTGELPWLAGLTFADVKGSTKIRQQGKSALRGQLEATTDGDGTPHARSLHRLPLSLAVFARAIAVGEVLGEKLLNRRSAERFSQLVTRAAVMADPQGRLALSNGASFATGSLLRTASSLAGLSAKQPPGRRLRQLPDDAPRSHGRRTAEPGRLPKAKRVRSRSGEEVPSTQSDWAELTCMRNNWSAGGDSCIVAHHDVFPQLSVSAFDRTFVDGDWELAIDINGEPVELSADWSCVCWFSDEDADYVELEQQIDGGLTVLRQVLLSRTDHWLMLADTARLAADATDKPATIHMTARLPLADGVATSDNRWTRELTLRGQKLKGRVFPLALPQERVDKADGTLSSAGGLLVLEQSCTGGALHMPLVIDWSPDRRRSEPLWRQLTVAEDGRRLPPHVASGQRLQIGRHQWLFYRSLQEGETGRTLLGHHTQHESVIAEFSTTGEVEPIVQVEQS